MRMTHAGGRGRCGRGRRLGGAAAEFSTASPSRDDTVLLGRVRPAHARSRRLVRSAIVLAVALAASFATVPSAQARGERHCVLRVVGQRPSGELVTAPATCFASFADAMASIGVDTRGIPNPNPETLAAAGRLDSAVTFAIGVHYDGANWTGSSSTVTGSNCLGGWMNVSSTWLNRISSTWNGCNRILHFDGYNLTGSYESTMGDGGNLSALNNRTNSIQYTS